MKKMLEPIILTVKYLNIYWLTNFFKKQVINNQNNM